MCIDCGPACYITEQMCVPTEKTVLLQLPIDRQVLGRPLKICIKYACIYTSIRPIISVCRNWDNWIMNNNKYNYNYLDKNT